MQLENIGGLVSTLFQKSSLILLNFADDIALFTFTQFGVHWAWLQWLSVVLLTITIVYWSLRLLRYCYRLQYQHRL